jgi:hypothetical protein
MTFDVTDILNTFDADRAEEALEQLDREGLESLVPAEVRADPDALSVVGAVAIAAILLHILGGSLARIGAEAVEFGLESAEFILEAADLAYQTYPEIRGLVLLLTVVAAIRALRRG